MQMEFKLQTIADACNENQAKELVQLLADRFPSIVGLYMPGDPPVESEEQTEFTVTLQGFDEVRERVTALKQMRTLRPDLELATGLELLNSVRANIATDFVKNVSKRQADECAKALAAVGFTVRVW